MISYCDASIIFNTRKVWGEKSGVRGEVKGCNSVVRVESDVCVGESRVATM